MSNVQLCGQTSQIHLYSKNTPTFEITITKADGTPFDLTGCNVYLSGKEHIHADTFLFDELCTITDAIEGQCKATLTSDQTAKVIKENGVAEIQVRKGSTILTLLKVPLIIELAVRNL